MTNCSTSLFLLFYTFCASAQAASIAISFSGTVSSTPSWPDGTPYEIVVTWDPAIAPVKFDNGPYDMVYYYSYGDGSLRAPGLGVDMLIGSDSFSFSSLDLSVGRTTVNLIDQPGDALDRFTLWVGDPNLNWDFLVLEFASVSNDELVTPGPEWDSASFDFSGDYIVTRVRFHPWGGTQYFNDDGGDVLLSVVPEPSIGVLYACGAACLAIRRTRKQKLRTMHRF